MQSELHTYTIGIVLDDKELGSDIIYFHPQTKLTNLNGDLRTYENNVTGIMPDADDITRTSGIRIDNRLPAVWLSGSDTRSTAPDVVAGEKVIIRRYSDTEDYYWSTKKQDLDLRKLEHIERKISNTPSELEKSTPDNVYKFTVSTLKKLLKIETVDNDGEACKYDISADTENGMLTITDSVGNEIELDSVNRRVKVVTNTILFDVKSIRCTGDLKVDGDIGADGDMGVGGDMTVGGMIGGIWKKIF